MKKVPIPRIDPALIEDDFNDISYNSHVYWNILYRM